MDVIFKLSFPSRKTSSIFGNSHSVIHVSIFGKRNKRNYRLQIEIWRIHNWTFYFVNE